MAPSKQRFLDYAPAPESSSILPLKDSYGLLCVALLVYLARLTPAPQHSVSQAR